MPSAVPELDTVPILRKESGVENTVYGGVFLKVLNWEKKKWHTGGRGMS